MNREMILRVADAIEAADKAETTPVMGFNMNYVREISASSEEDMTGHGCGTVSCIAGWTLAIDSDFKIDKKITPDDPLWKGAAAHLLGLDKEAAHNLFMAVGAADIEEVTPAEAIAVLRHLAETGEVDWSLAARDQTP